MTETFPRLLLASGSSNNCAVQVKVILNEINALLYIEELLFIIALAALPCASCMFMK